MKPIDQKLGQNTLELAVADLEATFNADPNEEMLVSSVFEHFVTLSPDEASAFLDHALTLLPAEMHASLLKKLNLLQHNTDQFHRLDIQAKVYWKVLKATLSLEEFERKVANEQNGRERLKMSH